MMLIAPLQFVFAQDEEVSAPETQKGMVFKPMIGLGVGMFTFYGDVTRGQKTNHPIVSRLGYDLRVTQALTPHFDMYFHVLFGKLGANERADARNLNFESTLRSGGLGLSYNFHHILKEDRVIDPYISVGFESFEFLSKTDLQDAYGSTYYYWSDGSIRNMDENDPNAKKEAKVIQRDYVYDTDVREQSIKLDGAKNYAERSFAIPFGIGANLHTTDRIKFRIGTAYHLTFTDYIDGITSESVGDRKGDAKNDAYLYTSFNVNYALSYEKESPFDESYGDVDFLAIDMGDEDGDGVIDFKDMCPHTPEGEIVDEKGCPQDTDGDGVADHLDKEEGTADSLFADADGIGLTDEELEKRWRMYMDSTGAYAKHETSTFVSDRIEKKGKKSYALRYEGVTEEIPAEVADLFLSYTNTKTIEEDGKTIFEVGDYDNLPEAIRRALDLQASGVTGADIIEKDGEGSSTKVSDQEIAEAASNAGIDIGQQLNKEEGELLYRIQLGAFSRPLSQNVFDNIPDLVYYKGDDGLTRYYTGAFATYQEAAKRKIDIVADGFSGAFVVPLKGGTKVPLSKTGSATPVNDNTNVDEHSTVNSTKSNLKFKVQIGAYNKQIPTDILEKFMSLGSVEQRKTDEGITKYVVGSFNTPEEAKAYKDEILEQGYSGAFLVGEFNGKIIPIDEALQLLNK